MEWWEERKRRKGFYKGNGRKGLAIAAEWWSPWMRWVKEMGAWISVKMPLLLPLPSCGFLLPVAKPLLFFLHSLIPSATASSSSPFLPHLAYFPLFKSFFFPPSFPLKLWVFFSCSFTTSLGIKLKILPSEG